MPREKRKNRRQPLRYTAWIALSPTERHGCVVSDVSDSGARIDVQDAKVLPDHFVLMLTSTGSARRFCRVMWRKPMQVGVKFARTLADAALSATPADGVPEPSDEMTTETTAPVQAESEPTPA